MQREYTRRQWLPRDARKGIDQSSIAGAVKPVTSQAHRLGFGGQGVAGGDIGDCGVKGSIETGVLRQVGGQFGQQGHRQKIMGVVQGGQRIAALYFVQNVVGHTHGRDQIAPAMHNAVGRSVDPVYWKTGIGAGGHQR